MLLRSSLFLKTNQSLDQQTHDPTLPLRGAVLLGFLYYQLRRPENRQPYLSGGYLKIPRPATRCVRAAQGEVAASGAGVHPRRQLEFG